MFIYSDLKNKNVIVTGANGDIGIAICQKYLEQQCHVYALYHQNRNNLDKLKKESEYCQHLYILQCDINNDKSIHDF
ncbi:SDR family NAD(P)-dependent oxidoreductase, partial [Proteus mirabilis]|nr:SDR family NAD(P)-dependent oxidoreductase [Proteus mirabilis]